MTHSPTVDYGIDLGTTNSVIAKASGANVEIVPNTLENDLTPSAVAVANKQLLVGQDALDTLATSATKFKRQMGTSTVYSFDDHRSMTPIELSAEVLKELKAAVQLRFDTKLESAVITVPAMFLQPQCEATKQAAELANINVATLLQEPIAAATAYLSESRIDGHYLVYDLGGGTFDVSIVRLRSGEMTVVAHGGDNYLGGTDFDKAIADYIISELQDRSADVSLLTKAHNYGRLVRACEQARIRLSVRDTQPVDLSDFDLPVTKIDLRRDQVEDIISPLVDTTIRLANERIYEASLKASDILNLILVGGPTRMPYIRRCLDEQLGILRSHDMNPMTIVARGAAIHASSLLKPTKLTKVSVNAAQTSTVDLELYYDPVSLDVETTISGKVNFPKSFEGEIRFAAGTGDWDTGWISLKSSAFVTSLRLSPNGTREFRIAVRDTNGDIWSTTPNSIVIRHGIAAAQPVSPYNYGVALQGSEVAQIIKAGQPLPAYGHDIFKAARTITAGSQEVLTVIFTEGLSPIANDNIIVGKFSILGRDLLRTIRENEPIEVRMRLDESRLLKAIVHIPLYDLEFAVTMVCEEVKPKQEDLAASLAELTTDLNQLTSVAEASDQYVLDTAATERERVEADLERIEQAEAGEAERLNKKLSDIRARVNNVKHKYRAQIAYIEAEGMISDAESVAQEFSDRPGMTLLAELRSEAQQCLDREDIHGLEAIKQSASQIFWRSYTKTERCWIHLVGQSARMWPLW